MKLPGQTISFEREGGGMLQQLQPQPFEHLHQANQTPRSHPSGPK